MLDNRDAKIGTLEAKIFAYEQIISKSSFAPMLEDDSTHQESNSVGYKENTVIMDKTRFQNIVSEKLKTL